MQWLLGAPSSPSLPGFHFLSPLPAVRQCNGGDLGCPFSGIHRCTPGLAMLCVQWGGGGGGRLELPVLCTWVGVGDPACLCCTCSRGTAGLPVLNIGGRAHGLHLRGPGLLVLRARSGGREKRPGLPMLHTWQGETWVGCLCCVYGTGTWGTSAAHVAEGAVQQLKRELPAQCTWLGARWGYTHGRGGVRGKPGCLEVAGHLEVSWPEQVCGPCGMWLLTTEYLDSPGIVNKVHFKLS